MSEKALDFSQASCPVKIEFESSPEAENNVNASLSEKNFKITGLTVSQQKLLQQQLETGLTQSAIISLFSSEESSPGVKDGILPLKPLESNPERIKKKFENSKHVGVSAHPQMVSVYTQTENIEKSR